jgi:hypothetical protein
VTKFLSRDDILSAAIKTAEVDVPEWGGKVKVRELSAHEVTTLGIGMVTDDGSIDRSQVPDMMTQAVVLGAIDENGERLFSEQDIELLKRKSFDPIQRIARAVLDMSGVSKSGRASDDGDGDPNP